MSNLVEFSRKNHFDHQRDNQITVVRFNRLEMLTTKKKKNPFRMATEKNTIVTQEKKLNLPKGPTSTTSFLDRYFKH